MPLGSHRCLVEVVGIEPTSERPSSREYHVRLWSVRTNTIFDFSENQQTPGDFLRSVPANLPRVYISEVPANLFTSFLLLVLAPQVSI